MHIFRALAQQKFFLYIYKKYQESSFSSVYIPAFGYLIAEVPIPVLERELPKVRTIYLSMEKTLHL